MLLRPDFVLSLLCISSAGCVTTQKAPDPQTGAFTIASGVSIGAYYETAQRICARYEASFAVSESHCRVQTGSSVANLKALESGAVDVAIAHSGWVRAAREGEGPFAGNGLGKDLRAVASLYPEQLNVLVRQDAKIDRLDDLPNARFAAKEGSGDAILFALVMRAKGWTEGDFASFQWVPPSQDIIDALCDGSIDALPFAVAHPSGTIMQAIDTCDAQLLPVTGPEISAEVQRHSAYSLAELPAGYYRNGDQAVASFGPRPVLVVRADTPDALIRSITEAIFSDIEAFKKLYPALAVLDPAEMVSASIPIPLHPAAEAYYRDRGLLD